MYDIDDSGCQPRGQSIKLSVKEEYSEQVPGSDKKKCLMYSVILLA